MRERGPFTDRIKREMKEDVLKYGLMLHGDMAYKYPKKHDRVSNYLRPMILKGVKIGNEANVKNINMWLLLKRQLNDIIKGSNGSLCKHDFQKSVPLRRHSVVSYLGSLMHTTKFDLPNTTFLLTLLALLVIMALI